MKKPLLLSVAVVSMITAAHGQTKFGDNKTIINGSSLLELESTNKGLLMPRISLTNTTTWGLATSTPVNGMVVYNINASMAGTTAAPTLTDVIGMYYWDGTKWVGMTGIQKAQTDSTYWALKGNAGTTPPVTVGTAVGANNFWGTTDAKNLAVGTNSTTRAIFDQNGSLYGGNATYDAGINPVNSLVWGTNNKDSANHSLMAGQNNVLASAAIGTAIFGSSNAGLGSSSLIAGALNKDSAGYSLIVGDNNTTAPTSAESNLLGTQNHVYNNSKTVNATSLITIIGAANILTFDPAVANPHGVSHATAILGQGNRVINTPNSTITGFMDTVIASSTVIMGGQGNKVYGATSPAVFGSNNKDSADYTLVSGLNNIVGAGTSYGVATGYGNNITGYSNQAVAHTSYIRGTNNAVMGGAFDTVKSGDHNIVLGGQFNTITGASNSLAAGLSNKLIAANKAAVFGGDNIDSADYTLVSGTTNTLSPTATFSTISGSNNSIITTQSSRGNQMFGEGNQIKGTYSMANIVGGYYNTLDVTQSSSNMNAVFGNQNTLSGSKAGLNLVGGEYNQVKSTGNGVTGSANVIGLNTNYNVVGGNSNVIPDNLNPNAFWGNNAVFGGENKDSATYTLVAGKQNSVSSGAGYSTVSGYYNHVYGGVGVAIFGQVNNAYNTPGFFNNTGGGFIAGALNNMTNNNSSAILGEFNTVYGDASGISGALVGGSTNTDSASYTFVAGKSNTIKPGGTYGVALGAGNTVGHSNSFALGNGATTTKAYQLVANFPGGVVFAPLPSYASDAAADADGTLPSGSLYKLTGSRAVFQKP